MRLYSILLWCQTNVVTKLNISSTVLCYQAFHHTADSLLAWNMSIPNKELFISLPQWSSDGSFVMVLTIMSAWGSLHTTICPLWPCVMFWNWKRQMSPFLTFFYILDFVLSVQPFCFKQLHTASLHRQAGWSWRRLVSPLTLQKTWNILI